MICFDLLFEWLWDVRHQLTSAESMICLMTFCFILLFSVEYGLVLGVLIHFLFQHMGLDVGIPKPKSSSSVALSTSAAIPRLIPNVDLAKDFGYGSL